MAAQPLIRVPAVHRERLRWIARLSDQEWERVLSGLQHGRVTVNRATLFDELRMALPEMADEDLSGLGDVLLALGSTIVGHSWDLDAVVAQVVETGDAGADELTLVLADRLMSALRAPAIGPTAKASAVVHAHERTLHTARILTDLRPVFEVGPELEPRFAVLQHVLEVRFFSATGDEGAFYVALDNSDLEALGQVIERAQNKATKLISLFESTGLRVEDVYE